MTLYENTLYMQDVQDVASLDLPWNLLQGKSLMLSGATGLLGSFFIDVIMEKNYSSNLNCIIYALGRNEEKAKGRFCKFADNKKFIFIPYDVKKTLVQNDIGTVDYVLHLASNTHPIQYSSDPIGTITTNIIGLQNMLDFAVKHHAKRFVFGSSNEIYGENRGDVEFFSEDYCGYINSNTMRAGYPESKRCGESLCQAYKVQMGLDVVIPRFTRSYGPTMLLSDTKAVSQFIKKGIAREDIVLKSAGNQFFSYTYVADAVSGLFTILLNGKNGEAYNIADKQGDIMLKDLAVYIAEKTGTHVVFEIPKESEAVGYSLVTKARLDGCKLYKLGWSPKYDIKNGICRTLTILSKLKY